MAAPAAIDTDGMQAEIAGFITLHWPELRARLGDLLDGFIDVACASAASHQIARGVLTARFVNVCCALGPNFERKPENEWALAILADERLGGWVKLHQLVVRASTELKRRASDGGNLSDPLLRTDGLLLDALDQNSRVANSDAVRAPRLTCDLEAVDIRLLELDWRREYRQQDGAWQRMPVAVANPSIRIGPGSSVPALVCVLTHAPGTGDAARLQVRLLTHAVCDQDHHPLVESAGEHGLWSWRGHQARAVSWLVDGPAPVPSANGLGVTLIEETLPRTSLLRAATCGLRDEGVPIGSVQTYVWAYPADQWLFVWQREPGASRQWPRPATAAPDQAAPATRVRIERDGVVVPSLRWATGFDETLDAELLRGFDKLFAAWQETTTEASMTVAATMLCGRAMLSWGWREGPEGLAGRPLMRVVGDLDLGHAIDIVLTGEVALGVTRTKVRLIVHGQATLRQQPTRDNAVPGLPEVLLAAAVRWSFDYRIEFDPLAVDEGALWSEAGPCTGAIVGEMGLRPRSGGGGGWQWFTRLDTQAVSVPVCLHDPVLGQTRLRLQLLPAMKFLDWSLG